MMQIGQIVFYHQGDHEAPAGYDRKLWRGLNGTRRHPAVVTNILDAARVNLVVFFDAFGAQARTHVDQLDASKFDVGGHCSESGWIASMEIGAAMADAAPAQEAPSASEPPQGEAL